MLDYPQSAPHGRHLIDGDWVEGDAAFPSEPAHGRPHRFSVGTAEHVDKACRAAEQAFAVYSTVPRKARAAFLIAIAEEIDRRGAAITAIGSQETGLPAARLDGERGRTTGQLRLFADHIVAGEYLDRRHDPALPDRKPAPRPDLKMVQRPMGPVAVFGASNFPLAFSTAGGDTASALAAGCSVVVKGHLGHPGTSEFVAEAILAAIIRCDMPRGVFNLIQSNGPDVGVALAGHPLIAAVGFTGSLRGGRALFDLCAGRATPIPFYGELGSINPVFLLPAAMRARSGAIAKGWAASLGLGAGQFCTNPGIAIVHAGESADRFMTEVAAELENVAEQVMLTPGIAAAYRENSATMAAAEGVTTLSTRRSKGRSASPGLLATTARTWQSNKALHDEVFGPLGLVVTVEDNDEMLEMATSLEGQLTATMHLEDPDTVLAERLIPVLERKAGRLLVNGFPTGVEVCDSMIHGGPYPASTNFGATSVGTLAIRRFLRPVCYQDMPKALLPIDLQ